MGKMSNVQDPLDDDDYVLLMPFSHQIGGHNIVLQYDDTTICKQLNLREKFFYETSPIKLREYLPEYKGTIEVRLQVDDKGCKTFLTHHHQNNTKTSSNSCNAPKNNGTTTTTTPSNSSTNNDNCTKTSRNPNELSNDDANLTTTTTTKDNDNDSSNKRNECDLINNDNNNNNQSQQLSNYVKSTYSQYQTMSQLQMNILNKKTIPNVSNFLLLENIVAKYKYPCILDIKMGTQQHGDDANEHKKKVQTLKCQMSTSSKIGSRLCGMQVYQVNTHNYINFDKYAGRTLNVDGFKLNLLQFLFNGSRFRIDVIDPIIDKLEDLYKIINDQETYRFYGSSLLVLYDGFDSSSEISHNNELEIVDTNNNSNEVDVAEDGYSAATTDDDEDDDEDDDDSIKTNSVDAEMNNEQKIMPQKMPKIDVRMIDFAHSTHSGYKTIQQETRIHNGPDRGYLFGLENLIKIFKEIKADCTRVSKSGGTLPQQTPSLLAANSSSSTMSSPTSLSPIINMNQQQQQNLFQLTLPSTFGNLTSTTSLIDSQYSLTSNASLHITLEQTLQPPPEPTPSPSIAQYTQDQQKSNYFFLQ